jgi:hypothetical protein
MSELEPLYRATTYRLFLPGGNCDLRLDVRSETLACWLETAGFDGFAILTAHNPGAVRCDEETNNAQQARLECDLLEAGFEPYVGENIADGEDWPAEESCFVPGLPHVVALELAQRYGQNALVCGGGDGVPKLVWVARTTGD